MTNKINVDKLRKKICRAKVKLGLKQHTQKKNCAKTFTP